MHPPNYYVEALTFSTYSMTVFGVRAFEAEIQVK